MKKIVAAQLNMDNCHAVIVDTLRVLIEKDGAGWYAQGLEIDYAAGGSSIEDVKQRFQEGLIDTMHEHLRVYGSLTNMIHPAPKEEWEKYTTQKDQHTLTTVALVAREGALPEMLPYKEIAYLEPRAA